MSAAASARWRLIDPAGLRIRRFDDEALVFNPLTWETHLLNDVAAHLVAVLEAGPCTEAELVATLDAREAGDVPIEAEVRHFLRELADLGLIENFGGMPA